MHLGASLSGTQLGGSSPVLRTPSEDVGVAGEKAPEVHGVPGALEVQGVPGAVVGPGIPPGPQGVEGTESRHGLANEPLTEVVAALLSSSPLAQSWETGKLVGGLLGREESTAEWEESTADCVVIGQLAKTGQGGGVEVRSEKRGREQGG